MSTKKVTLNQVAGTMEKLSTEVGRISGCLAQVASRLDQVSGRLDDVSGRLDSVSDRLEQVSGRLEQVNTGLSAKIDQVSTDLNEFKEFVQENVATKEDLKAYATKEDLGKFKLDMIDHLDRKVEDMSDPWTVRQRKTERKVNKIVDVMEKNRLALPRDIAVLRKIQAFSV